MSPRIAAGSRDATGKWHADDPSLYPPMDVHGTLPWTVLRQDSPGWQARKKWWLSLGVHADAPRAHAPAMITTGRHGRLSGGLSRFDPHLAELLTTWYSPPEGLILDPFAGGPVRGLVAAHLGRPYEGIDLLEDQVTANRQTAADWEQRGLLPGPAPIWEHSDAAAHLAARSGPPADMILTCPPYHNRERYSDDPRDLSAMRWPAFADAFQTILHRAVLHLREDRFAAVVLSDVRDHKGHLRGLPALATTAMRDAGAYLVAEYVLIEPGGLRAKTMRPPWEACRTPTRTHQYVHVYVKGDRRHAAAAVKGDPTC